MLSDRSQWGWCRVCVLVVVCAGFVPARRLAAEDEPSTAGAGDENRQAQIAARFMTVLEKSPRRGTALDRVYGHHVEFGTLDKFLDDLHERVKKSPTDGAGWMLLGLFEAHRGEDAKAADAFREAEKNRPEDALASYYLGQALLLVGQPDQAVEAFERAIARNPPRADLLEIFQQLGRVHQRAQRNDAALAVWKRLESLFPNDPRVQEQIAVTLVEEGQYAVALPRYEQLVKLVHDDYRRTMFQIEVAELKIRQNRRDEGLADFENILAELNPDSWLHHDVRRRIEEVFLRTGDQDGLVKYYERWAGRHPEDVDAMARLAKFLASAARVPEAMQWMEKALKLAPKRIELRRAFIEQLVDEQRFSDAIAQYALLAKAESGNSDLLREWGKLVLRDKSQDIEKRKAEATRIWQEIVAAHSKDAVTLSQVADLFRQANINEQAIELYKKAIELAPEEPQYREYLGEFYHVLKRPDEALATWKAIAEEPRRTAVNVARLAEVYNSFGYADQAIAEITAASKLDPKEFNYALKAAEYQSHAEKYEDALASIATAEKLAANDDERDAAIKARIDTLQSSRQLDDEIEQMAAKVAKDPKASAQDWNLLARYYEADRRWNEATEAINKAIAIDGKAIPILSTSARIAELSGDFARAAEMNRQLAQVDRRSRSDHLMNVARLESQLGRAEEAMQAGKDLIASAPGNTDNYEFYAQLCFRLGKQEEGLDTLRKAARINPTEPHLTTVLGAALADQFRADEAIEVYWRAFDRTEELDDKTSLTAKLTELYLQTNQFDKLVERFERERKEDEKHREMTICLAQAYNTSGDYGMARREMESLLNQDSQDTNLLQQISKLCEQASDIDAAVDYQRRLAQIAPGPETEFRLATLLQSRGDRDEASEIYVRLTQREEDQGRLLRSLDSLLTQGSFDSVIAITEPRLSQQRDDWELLYREIVAWASLDKIPEARARCQRLLAIKLPHDTLGVAAAEKMKQAEKKAKSDKLRGIESQQPQRQSPLVMLGNSYQVRQAVGLNQQEYYGNSGPQRVWAPEAFGLARMAAYGWQLKFEEDERSKTTGDDKPKSDDESFVAPLAKAAADKNADRDTLYDWMYVEQLRGNSDLVFRMAKQLAASGGKEEQRFYLTSLTTRNVNSRQNNVYRSGNEEAKKNPLTEDEVELMLKCFEAISVDDASKTNLAAMYGGQVAYSSNGQMYVNVGGNWIQVSSGFGGAYLSTVLQELRTAGRDAKANEMLAAQVSRAKTHQELASALNLQLSQEKPEELEPLYEKWVAAAKDEIAKTPVNTSRQTGRSQAAEPLAGEVNALMEWMGKLGPEEENAKILTILDPALDISIAQAKKRRLNAATRAKRPTSSQQVYYGNQFNLKYGKEQIYVNVEFPRPNEYVDQASLMLLREVFEVFKRNDVIADLSKHMRKRLEEAKDDDKTYDQLMLGYVLWWNEEQEEAAQVLSAAADGLPDDPAFRLETAKLHESLGDVDRALEIVDSIAPRDQNLVQQRETMALQLAERLGDIERARQAAERLFGLRLDNDAQLALVERMRRLGLNEMAEAVVSRVQRRAGNQTSSLATLMAMYQGQGKSDLAQQIAHTILRRTTAQSSPQNARLIMRGGMNQGDATRMQALQLLQQTGALKEMTARLEEQLEKSPNSPRLYEQLIEYYQAAGARDKVQGVLEKAISQRSDAITLRLQLAKQYEQGGKLKEACDQYLEVLKQKPALLGENFWEVRNTFTRAQRSLDLVQALQTINLQSMGQPWYIIDLVGELMQDRGGKAKDGDMEMMLALFERVFEAYPTYRNQLISRIYNQELWKKDRIYKLAKRGILPSASEVNSQPWFGLESIYSYSSGGTVNAMFHQLLSGINGTDKMADLRTAIEESIKQNAGWYGGEAMLALIDLKQGKKDAAKERFEKLVAKDEVLKSMPPDTCWIIGQELDQFEDTRAVALQLFESASNNAQNRGNNQLQYSPLSRLVKLYGQMNRKEDARQMLLKQLRTSPNAQYDAQYASYMRIENSVWAGDQFLDLGFPVDAIRLYRQLIDDADGLEQAGNWYGNRPDYFASKAQAGLKKALGSIKEGDAKEAVKQLLTPNSDLNADGPALDLMVSVPDAKTIRTKHIESSLATLLESISREAKLGPEIDERLATLAAERPNDLSAPIALAAFRRETKSDQAVESLKSLVAALEAKPLEEIPAGRRPNSRQRREALERAAVWIVARDYLLDKEQKEVAEKLATTALEAARRQVDNTYTAAILFDWGKLAIDAGDRETAEQKWTELLTTVTKRPERRDRPAQPARPIMAPPGAVPAPTPAAAPRAQLPLKMLNRFVQSSMVRAAAPPAALLVAFAAIDATGAVPPTPSAAVSPAVAPAPAGTSATPSPAAQAPPATAAKSKGAAAADVTPPLTISQFRMAAEVALAAAENGMPALSQRAVQQALAGGIPVPDPAKVELSQQRRVVRVTPNGQQPDEGNPTEAEVATTLRKIIAKWQGDAYAPQTVYDLLHPVVLPASRPADIMLYADTSKLRDGTVKSLGETLVDWARRADKLADLNERVEARKKNRQSLVPALVLQTLADLAAEKKDQAKSHLDELGKVVEQGALPQMVQLACIAALAGNDVPELEDSAFKILQVAVNQQTQGANNNGNGNEERSLGKLAAMVSRHLKNEPNKVKKFVDTFMAGRQAQYARYGGDYGLYLQWQDWANVANEAAKAGVASLSLDYMGRVVDFHYQNNSRPSVIAALAASTRLLRAGDAQKRYETWRDWTLPAAGRQSVRLIAEWTPPLTTPAAFLPNDFAPLTGDYVCNLTELIDAAAAAGKFEELREQAKAAFDQKLTNANVLQALVLIHAKDEAALKPIVADLVKTLPQRAKVEQNQVPSDLWGDYLIYHTCIESPEWLATGRKMLKALQAALRTRRQMDMYVHVVNDDLLRQAEDSKAAFRPNAPSQLQHWLAVSPRDIASPLKPQWIIHEGNITHLPGPGNDTLQLKYPLTGSFSFAVDVFDGQSAEGEAGYDGVVLETHAPVVVAPLSAHESLRPSAALRHPGYNRVEIRVADGRVKHFLNNYLVYEEKTSLTSPFPLLMSHGPRVSAYRNVAISGSPVIPRSVSLFAANRMDGWNCTFFGESQPRHRLMAQKPKDENDYIYYQQRDEPQQPDWSVQDGMLIGNAKDVAADDAQSWVYYQRPLCDQESLRYEFFYSPGNAAAFPAIGRTAFVLEPDGVAVHWIGNANWDYAVLGIAPTNRVREAANRRGPEKLPLKAEDWNSVAVTLKSDTIEIKLNDTVICERKLEPENSRLIGIYRDKRQTAKVRAATLSGPWPEQFSAELQRDLLATAAHPSDADRQIVGGLLNDLFVEYEAATVVRQARSLAEEARLEALKKWVMPSPDHVKPRLFFDFASHVAADDNQGSPKLAHDGLICPAVELVETAAKLKRLPELRAEFEKIESENKVIERGKLGLLAIVDIVDGNDDGAQKSLAAVQDLIVKHTRSDTQPRARSPEVIVAWLASERTALQKGAADLAATMLAIERDKKTGTNDNDWRRIINTVAGRAQAALAQADATAAKTSDSQPPQWTMVAERNQSVRRPTSTPDQWAMNRGGVKYRPSGTGSWLYFQSPLRGTFEIAGVQTTGEAKELVATYGGHAAAPQTGLKSRHVFTLPHGNKKVTGELAIPNFGAKTHFRVTVDGGKITTFANDAKVHEETIVNPSPWLVLHASSIGNEGTIDDLRITGDVEIPTELDLVDTFSVACWQADLYGESVTADANQDGAVWRRAGEEIIGGLRSDASAKPLEALLAYQRPMLEDGTIEYEFFYTPGEMEVHPAIGRTALLLHPDGVKRHQLTRAEWETSGLKPDNETPLEGAASAVPLKPSDWNRVKLALVGDQFVVTVNDAEVAKWKVAEPPAERLFGLFRYATSMKCRIRKVIYRGDWAKKLPAVADQQLAATGDGVKQTLLKRGSQVRTAPLP